MIGLRLVLMIEKNRDWFDCSHIGNTVKLNKCELMSKRRVLVEVLVEYDSIHIALKYKHSKSLRVPLESSLVVLAVCLPGDVATLSAGDPLASFTNNICVMPKRSLSKDAKS